MVYRGTIRNGQVVLEESARLPEGAHVRVEIENSHLEDLPTSDMTELLKIAGTLDSGRRDGSVNHDRYISGVTRAESAE